MNILDSSGWLEYIGGSPAGAIMKPVARDTAELIVPAITIYEVVKKLLREDNEEYAYSVAMQMEQGRLIPLDASLSIFAAKLSLHYRLPMADSIIYATAQLYNATLWTTDTHFENLPGVRYFKKP